MNIGRGVTKGKRMYWYGQIVLWTGGDGCHCWPFWHQSHVGGIVETEHGQGYRAEGSLCGPTSSVLLLGMEKRGGELHY